MPVFSCMSTGMPRPLSSHGHAVVRLDGDVDAVAVAGHRLVDGVVDDLVDEVVQAALVGRADVHAGAAADGLQPLQHLDVAGGVRGLLLAALCGRRLILDALSYHLALVSRRYVEGCWDRKDPRVPLRSRVWNCGVRRSRIALDSTTKPGPIPAGSPGGGASHEARSGRDFTSPAAAAEGARATLQGAALEPEAVCRRRVASATTARGRPYDRGRRAEAHPRRKPPDAACFRTGPGSPGSSSSSRWSRSSARSCCVPTRRARPRASPPPPRRPAAACGRWPRRTRCPARPTGASPARR